MHLKRGLGPQTKTNWRQEAADGVIPFAVAPPPSCQGYFYVEAHKEAHVKEALKGLRMIYQSKPPKLVRGGSLSPAAGRVPCLLGCLHWGDACF